MLSDCYGSKKKASKQDPEYEKKLIVQEFTQTINDLHISFFNGSRQRVRFTMMILYGFLFHRKMNVSFLHEDVDTEPLDAVKDVEEIEISNVAIHEREGFIRKKWNDLKELTARKMSIKVNYSVDIFQVNAETKKKDFTATEKPLTLVINFLNLSLSFLMKMTGSVSIYGFFSSAK